LELGGGFLADLVIDLLEQMLSNDALEIGVVHIACEKVLVLFHAVNEKAFEGLLEHETEIVNRVRGSGLPERLVGDCFLAYLVEEKLVGRGEISSEAVVDEVNELG
jgi:hypothetical protein